MRRNDEGRGPCTQPRTIVAPRHAPPIAALQHGLELREHAVAGGAERAVIVNARDPARARGAHRVEHGGVEHARRDDDVRPLPAQLLRDGAAGAADGGAVFVRPANFARGDARRRSARELPREQAHANTLRRQGGQHRLPVALRTSHVADAVAEHRDGAHGPCYPVRLRKG